MAMKDEESKKITLRRSNLARKQSPALCQNPPHRVTMVTLCHSPYSGRNQAILRIDGLHGQGYTVRNEMPVGQNMKPPHGAAANVKEQCLRYAITTHVGKQLRASPTRPAGRATDQEIPLRS
mgnify:CR=1 FL=1